jgi:hypothetical protein
MAGTYEKTSYLTQPGSEAIPPGPAPYFNTLRAMVDITRRIRDTRLLPPHSRALNFSPAKRLLETTALYHNKAVTTYYKQYKQSDITSDDLLNVADAELRKKKGDIREYVDRVMCPREFFESELEIGPFTAAFATCLQYVQQRAPQHPGVAMLFAKPTLKWTWSPPDLAAILLRYGDLRGNLYFTADEGKNRHLYSTWQSNHELFLIFARIEKDVAAGRAPTAADLAAFALRAGVNPAALDGRGKTRLLGADGSLASAPAQVAPAGCSSALSDWIDLKNHVPMSVMFDAVKNELEAQTGRLSDEPLTLFDIALLGGLNPYAYRIERLEYHAEDKFGIRPENATAYETDPPIPGVETHKHTTDREYEYQEGSTWFFEHCMRYFDSRGDGGQDLGVTLFQTPVARRSLHTSYLPFLWSQSNQTPNARPDKRPGRLFYFGARQAAEAEPPKPPYPEYTRRGGAIPASKRVRDHYHPVTREDVDAPAYRRAAENFMRDDQPAQTDVYFLERFCDSCFERGVELYLRLVQEMIKTQLNELRQPPATSDAQDFIKPFSKLVASFMQRAELAFPKVNVANAAATRLKQRANNRAMTEAKYDIALVCKFEPEVALEGYTIGGDFVSNA